METPLETVAVMDFAAIKDRVDLVEVAGRYTELRKLRCGEHHGPCPFCGGTDRFHVFKDRRSWHCRQCNERGDVIDLVAKKQGVTKPEAGRILTGGAFEAERKTPAKRNPMRGTQVHEGKGWDTDEWQAQARAEVERATAAMDGSEGAKYMASRGILPVTWQAFGIGYGKAYGRPAVVIPWYDSKRVVAVKYRHVDELARTNHQKRFTQKAGSEAILYGLPQLRRETGVLIAAEGEINALSLWQAVPHDVLSVGPEGNSRGVDLVAKIAKDLGYREAVLWFDNEQVAQRAAAAFRAGARRVKVTPMRSPGGADANDILRERGAPVLWQLVEGMRGVTMAATDPYLTALDLVYTAVSSAEAKGALMALSNAEADGLAGRLRWLQGHGPALREALGGEDLADGVRTCAALLLEGRSPDPVQAVRTRKRTEGPIVSPYGFPLERVEVDDTGTWGYDTEGLAWRMDDE